MMKVGVWRWPLVLLLGVLTAAAAWQVKGNPIPFYQAQAVLQTADPARLGQDLGRFQAEPSRRAIATALGWINDKSSSEQISKATDRLSQVLNWQAAIDQTGQVQLTGTGKDPAGIAWVVNTAARAAIGRLDDPARWSTLAPAAPPAKPIRYDGWQPMAMGAGTGFLIGLILFGGRKHQKPMVEPLKEEPAVMPTAAAPIADPEPTPLPETVLPPVEEVLPTPESTPEPAPIEKPSISLQVIHPAVADWPTLYADWSALAGEFLKEKPPAGLLPKLDALIQKSQEMCAKGVESLLTYLARQAGQESVTAHAAHMGMLSVAWCVVESLTDEETHCLTIAALMQAQTLRAMTPRVALRARAEQSRASAARIDQLSELSDAQCAMIHGILSKLGSRQGMNPAMNEEEERQNRLSTILSQLIREEKIIRRKALLLKRSGSQQSVVNN